MAFKSKITRRALVKSSLASAGLPVVSKLIGSSVEVQAEAKTKGDPSFAAIPGQVGGQDIFGAYDVDPNWPKPLSALPGNEKWTWGSGESVFAENPDRVFILQRGELPNIPRPKETDLPQLGPSLEVSDWPSAVARRHRGQPAGAAGWPEPWHRERGLALATLHRSVNSKGDIVETWPEWDKMLRRPHAIYINPYDKDKYIWLVDDYRHAIFKFTHDMKKLVLTIGMPNVHGADGKHFYRPTYLAWLPDSTMFVADGYVNTRVAKFDKNGSSSWTGARRAGLRKRHGRAISTACMGAADVPSGRVFVNDRTTTACRCSTRTVSS